MHLEKFTLNQLFPTLPATKGETMLTLIPGSDVTVAQYVGDAEGPTTLNFDNMPSAVAVAVKAGQRVEFSYHPTKGLSCFGMTSGQLSMLVPRFYSQVAVQAQRPNNRPRYAPKTNRHEEASDLTYALKA